MAALEYLLALDYGNKRVGVAIAHEIARLPRPLTTLHNNETLLSEIRKLVDSEHVKIVVVGLPRGMDGGYTSQTRAAEHFATELSGVLMIPVELEDETLTSVDAEATLAGHQHAKGDIDAMAACFILERYLVEHPTQEARA
jgi:putative Holliday junction resolvase